MGNLFTTQKWTDHEPQELSDEFRELLAKDDAVCFIKWKFIYLRQLQ